MGTDLLEQGSPAHKKFFIGGLSWTTTEDSVKQFFSNLGFVVEKTQIMRNKSSGRSRGFGFVILNESSCLDNISPTYELDGRVIEVKYAVPKEVMGAKTKKIFVGGLPASLNETVFQDHFSQYGPIVEAQIMKDRKNSRSRGFGFIRFQSEDSVEDVLKDQHFILGKVVEVKKALPKHAISATTTDESSDGFELDNPEAPPAPLAPLPGSPSKNKAKPSDSLTRDRQAPSSSSPVQWSPFPVFAQPTQPYAPPMGNSYPSYLGSELYGADSPYIDNSRYNDNYSANSNYGSSFFGFQQEFLRPLSSPQRQEREVSTVTHKFFSSSSPSELPPHKDQNGFKHLSSSSPPPLAQSPPNVDSPLVESPPERSHLSIFSNPASRPDTPPLIPPSQAWPDAGLESSPERPHLTYFSSPSSPAGHMRRGPLAHLVHSDPPRRAETASPGPLRRADLYNSGEQLGFSGEYQNRKKVANDGFGLRHAVLNKSLELRGEPHFVGENFAQSINDTPPAESLSSFQSGSLFHSPFETLFAPEGRPRSSSLSGQKPNFSKVDNPNRERGFGLLHSTN